MIWLLLSNVLNFQNDPTKINIKNNKLQTRTSITDDTLNIIGFMISNKSKYIECINNGE